MRHSLPFGVCLLLLLCLLTPANAQLTGCGGERERPCVPTDEEFIQNGSGECDNGLVARTFVCGCELRGVLGNCLVPIVCRECVNLTRKVAEAGGFESTWEAWALANQRTLAIDEPVNRVMRLAAHNAYNTLIDDPANLAPNQYFSLTDQLRSGARVLELDIHWISDHVRVGHCGDAVNDLLDFVPPGCGPFERLFANAVKEIRNWMRANPSEILVFQLDDKVPSNVNAGVNLPLTTYLGQSRIFTVTDLRNLRNADGVAVNTDPASGSYAFARWPTRRELLAAGKRVIVTGVSGHGSSQIHHQPAHPSWGRGGGFLQGKYTLDYKLNTAPRLELGEDEPRAEANWLFDPAQRVCWSGRGFSAEEARLPEQCQPEHDYAVCYSDDADRVGGVNETRNIYFIHNPLGWIEEADVAKAVRCNVVSVKLDYFAAKHRAPVPGGRDRRQRFAVWSWKYGDRGHRGDCAMLDGDPGPPEPATPDNQWESRSCAEEYRFACARPRSESGLDPLDWRDPLGEEWCITGSAGPWQEGLAACRSQCPGYVFGVPVNGYQNERLNAANTSNADLWLHYTDQDHEGRWVIPRVEAINSQPVANAGPDRTVECGDRVTLDGSASTDADREPLSYTWTGPFGTLAGEVVEVALEPGDHVVTLLVDDGFGGTDTDEALVQVADTTPPTVKLALSPGTLWPPDNKLVDIDALLEVSDRCGSPDFVTLVSIASSEPKGTPAEDIQEAELDTDDREFKLRARPGRGHARIYTVSYSVSDLDGNTTQAVATVTVPHDRRGGRPLRRSPD